MTLWIEYGVIFIVFTAAVIYAVKPLLLPPSLDSRKSVDVKSDLKRRKQLLYRQIKELEIEYSAGNLTVVDYESNRQEIKIEVSAVISDLIKLS
ncbi:MAG: hypothetical protein V3S48_01805 [Candidatus Neomarinimicrobiota bacterium]